MVHLYAHLSVVTHPVTQVHYQGHIPKGNVSQLLQVEFSKLSKMINHEFCGVKLCTSFNYRIVYIMTYLTSMTVTKGWGGGGASENEVMVL